MIIYPSIDLRGGKVVRLKQGDPARQTTFSDNPVETAQQWIDQGAQWLHMVNLDGTLSEANDSQRILDKVSPLGIPVQFGGGLRSLADIRHAFDQGAARVVLGTIAVSQPEIVEQAVERWGTEAICVGLDARNGRVATHGWQNLTDTTPLELGKAMAQIGVRHALFTDVHRDGGLSGANIQGTIDLGRETSLQVIASGGVSTVPEIQLLKESGAVAGAVIGMALYTGQLSLEDAIVAGGN